MHFTIIVAVVAVAISAIPITAVISVAAIIFNLIGDAILVDINSPVTSFVAVINAVLVTVYVPVTINLAAIVSLLLILLLYLATSCTARRALRLNRRQPGNCYNCRHR